MAYDLTMAAVATGDGISAAMWNILVNNIDYLHDTREQLSVGPISNTSMSTTGDFHAPSTNNVNNATHTGFQVFIPANFGALVSAVVLMLATTTYSAEADFNTDFGGVGENYNANSGNMLNQAVSFTANQIKSVDIASILTGLAAGDMLGLRVSNSSGANAGNWQALQLVIVYTRSDSIP